MGGAVCYPIGVSGFTQKGSYALEDLLACARGELFGPGNPQLPMPPMLMLDSIPVINDSGGANGKGEAEAQFAITPDKWFFDCHFVGDPVMPGCLGMDGLWQLLGFYLGWAGGEGRGRAISVGAVKFSGQIRPTANRIVFRLDIKRLMMRKLVLGIADGKVLCDGEQVFEAADIRVGLFRDEA